MRNREDEVRVNHRIRAKEVRLIDQEGRQVGIVPLGNALQMAADAGLDLVEVAPQAVPPVCRIMDFGKFKYQRKKRLAEARKRQAASQIKEIKLRYSTDKHDVDTKVRRATEFLQEGHKVRFLVRFRGREIQFVSLAKQLLEGIAAALAGVGTVESPPRMEGRFLTMYVAPKPQRQMKGASSDAKKEGEN